MRILQVTPSYLPATRYGGPIRSVHGLCRALVEKGHDVLVATTPIDGRRNSHVPLGKVVDVDSVAVRYFSTRGRIARRLYHSGEMRRFLANEVRRFDVVHAHAVFLAPQTHAIRLGARAGVPVLLAPRGMLDRELLKSRSRWIKAAWLALVERRNLSQASALHFTTRAEGVRYEELGLPRRPSRVIPNGLGLSRFVNLNEVTTLLSLRDPHELLCLGRVNWKKGLDRAIRGLAYLGEPWRLTIAGNDEEGYTPVLERLARELGVASRVRFVGEQRGEAKWSLLDRAGCLLLPSRSENFGIVVLEAMARGCPVAVTPEVGLADFVREHRAGLVIGSEPEAMAAQVAAWASNRAEVAEEVGRALSAAHSRFSWPAVASAMVEWYRELAAGRTRAA